MNPIQNVTIGADPEVFFLNRNGTPISSEGLIGGDKSHPVPMEKLPNGFFVQEDNVTAEFNIPPAKTAQEFVSNITTGLKYVRGIAAKNKLHLAFVPDLDFTVEQLSTKHCQTLGCNPDYNIWMLEENPQPQAPQSMRAAGGHVHIGWSEPEWPQIVLVGRLFDVFVTLPSILVTPKNRRRTLYGKAGATRPKPYGIECRSADNFWLSRKDWTLHVYNNIQRFLKEIVEVGGEVLNEIVQDYSPQIITAINEHDVELAHLMCERFNVPLFKQG